MVLQAGCAGTRNAYTAAKGDPEATAKVVSEHYIAVVHELNTLKQDGTLNGEALVRAQALVSSTKPLIDQLAIAAQHFAAVKNAKTEEELTIALNEATLAVSKLIDIIRAARGN